MSNKLEIRPLVLGDFPSVSKLSSQLGYIIEPEIMVENYSFMAQCHKNGFFVASLGDELVGWVHVYGVQPLQSKSYAEIGGVVVNESHRRLGIGRSLIFKCEEWAKEHGFSHMRLRSGVQRPEAHQFYEIIGYRAARTSVLFRKDF